MIILTLPEKNTLLSQDLKINNKSMIKESSADLYPSEVHSETAQVSGFSVVRSCVNTVTA